MVTELLPLATYCALMSATPGPNNMMLTASGARFGYRGTLPHILGINTGGAVQTFVCCLGLGALFLAWPPLQAGLRFGGAAYLLVLAWQLLRSRGAQSAGLRPMGFVQGALFQAVNPKAWMKALTVAAVFVPAGWSPVAGAALVSAIGFVIGFPCVSMWALFGVAIRRWLDDPRRRRAFDVIMAATLAALAAQFLA